MRASVKHDLFDYARETANDGLETAGFLFGPHVRSWHQEVSVGRVMHMVERRAHASASLDIGELVAEKATIRRAEADGHFGEIGCWHTHPSTREGEPSEQDLATWLNARDFLDVSSYLGLILTADPSDQRWTSPHVHAWSVRRTQAQTAVCEPVAVRWA